MSARARVRRLKGNSQTFLVKKEFMDASRSREGLVKFMTYGSPLPFVSHN